MVLSSSGPAQPAMIRSPEMLFGIVMQANMLIMPLSSSGPGHLILNQVTGVRFSVAAHKLKRN